MNSAMTPPNTFMCVTSLGSTSKHCSRRHATRKCALHNVYSSLSQQCRPHVMLSDQVTHTVMLSLYHPLVIM